MEVRLRGPAGEEDEEVKSASADRPSEKPGCPWRQKWGGGPTAVRSEDGSWRRGPRGTEQGEGAADAPLRVGKLGLLWPTGRPGRSGTCPTSHSQSRQTVCKVEGPRAAWGPFCEHKLVLHPGIWSVLIKRVHLCVCCTLSASPYAHPSPSSSLPRWIPVCVREGTQG